MSCWDERFEELCALLRRNDGRITRLTTFNGLNGYGRRLGEALLLGNNTTVTHLVLCLDDVLASQDGDTENATPLLSYLQSSTTALENVELSTSFEHAQARNLTRLVLQSLARNTNELEVDVSGIPFLSSNDLALFVRNTTSCKSLIFNDQQLQMEGAAALRRVATAFGENNTLQDVTIVQRDSSNIDVPARMPVPDPILLQLGTSSTLKSLCLVMCGNAHHFAASHFEAMASVLASTGALEYLELVGYTFNKPTLEPVLYSLKRNATVRTLCLKHCQMDEDATADFVQFVQRDCNKAISVLKRVHLKIDCGSPTFHDNVGNVSATMLIGSSIECLHVCQPPPCAFPEFNLHAVDMAAFFEILIHHEAMVQVADLRLEYVNTEDAKALYDYLSQSTSLRHLTVSALDRAVNPDGRCLAHQWELAQCLG